MGFLQDSSDSTTRTWVSAWERDPPLMAGWFVEMWYGMVLLFHQSDPGMDLKLIKKHKQVVIELIH